MSKTFEQRYRAYRIGGHGRLSALLYAMPPDTILIAAFLLALAIGLFSTWRRT